MAGNIVRTIDDWVRPQNVLMSVSDKRDLQVIVNGLVSINDKLRIFSTGGTFEAVQKILGPEAAKRHLVQVSDYTGQPETQGGLVKTLDFKIYLGLLTETYNEAHRGDLVRTQAVAIDVVVVNLYPFQQTVQKQGVTVEEARANIDIGGPCMLRAAAKNYLRVAPICDPSDYGPLTGKLRAAGGRLDLRSRFQLAKKAFAHTAEYDAAIARYLAEQPDQAVECCYEKKGA